MKWGWDGCNILFLAQFHKASCLASGAPEGTGFSSISNSRFLDKKIQRAMVVWWNIKSLFSHCGYRHREMWNRKTNWSISILTGSISTNCIHFYKLYTNHIRYLVNIFFRWITFNVKWELCGNILDARRTMLSPGRSGVRCTNKIQIQIQMYIQIQIQIHIQIQIQNRVETYQAML